MNKAGVMYREDLNANSRFVFIGITSSEKIVFIFRKSKGGAATTITKSGYSIPCYVKIVKEGDNYSGYVSLDDKDWDLIGSTTNKMNSTDINVGLALTSHNNTELSNAKFKDFTYSTTPKIILLDKSNINTTIVQQSQHLKIYPNPTTKNFSIDFNLNEPDDAVLSIIEIGTGIIVSQESLRNFSGKYHRVFTDAIIHKGNYIVVLKTNKGVQSKQLQIQ